MPVTSILEELYNLLCVLMYLMSIWAKISGWCIHSQQTFLFSNDILFHWGKWTCFNASIVSIIVIKNSDDLVFSEDKPVLIVLMCTAILISPACELLGEVICFFLTFYTSFKLKVCFIFRQQHEAICFSDFQGLERKCIQKYIYSQIDSHLNKFTLS